MEGDLVHFDIPAKDIDRLSNFYRNVLGWKTTAPGGFEDYLEIETSDGENAVGGGMSKKVMPQQTVINYYDVESVEETNERVRANGGEVIVEKMSVPGFGYLSVCADPEGNPFGSWLEDPNAA